MEKLSKIVNTLKSKWLRDTGKTIFLIIILVALFVAANITIDKIHPNDIDLTQEKLYSLTDSTKTAIAAIPEEDKFNIYIFDYAEGSEFYDFVIQYSKLNKNINVEAINISERPDLVQKYNVEEGYGTIIIESGDKYKIFTSSDFASYDYSSSSSTDLTEQKITNGIIAISSIGKTTTLYATSGHEEFSMSAAMIYLSSALDLENYEVKDLDLLSTQAVPDDCEGLLIMSPTTDFSESETNAIKEYINKRWKHSLVK